MPIGMPLVSYRAGGCERQGLRTRDQSVAQHVDPLGSGVDQDDEAERGRDSIEPVPDGGSDTMGERVDKARRHAEAVLPGFVDRLDERVERDGSAARRPKIRRRDERANLAVLQIGDKQATRCRQGNGICVPISELMRNGRAPLLM